MNVLTVNLEKKLIRENRQINTPQELLVIKEYDKHAGLEKNDALQRVGLNRVVKAGMYLKQENENHFKDTKRFNKERVFHISQIEAICNKYYLRFLTPDKYNSIIDKDLPHRISVFETAYDVRCNTWNTRIVAPKESFELKERDKDPLFFYQINDEYFYLIHKWGNDLSVFRRFIGLLSNHYFCAFLLVIVFPLIVCFLNVGIGIVVSLICLLITLVINGICISEGDGDRLRFLPLNRFQSNIK